MPKDQETTDPESQETETQEPNQDKFWEQFREETARVVDARLAERDRKRQAGGKRRSNERRATVPGMIADLMFGPDKS